MKRLYIFYSFLICSCLSCSNESNPTNSGTYIPQIENQWFEKGKPDHIFQLSSDVDSVSQGNITGFEDYPDSGFFGSQLNGLFNNRHVEFDVNRPTGTIKFSGSFVADTAIQLSSKAGSITIIHF